ncbi:hypothetical protein DFQ30_002103, partial [Apophysomyces sp. BC1015]
HVRRAQSGLALLRMRVRTRAAVRGSRVLDDGGVLASGRNHRHDASRRGIAGDRRYRPHAGGPTDDARRADDGLADDAHRPPVRLPSLRRTASRCSHRIARRGV